MTTLGAPDVLLVRYGELALKGGNRRRFELVLGRKLRSALKFADARVERESGRLLVYPARRWREAAERAAEVFGIKSVSPAWSCPTEFEAVTATARAVFEGYFADHPARPGQTFAVDVRRADKRFPMPSVEFERYLADLVLEREQVLSVRLKEPDVQLGVDLREKRTFVFIERIPGPGGLPVGTIGQALCLLSGGIDSPVAAWLSMKRGCHVGFVSFHSFPYLGEGSKRKVRDLARRVSRFQGKAVLYVVPFTEVQEAIRDSAPEAYRTVLYRRMMNRIAGRIARTERFGALVTGESVGQVASQTLENMHCVGAASDLLVLRPLLTYDKEETIELARRIGTYELSTLPEPDCCTVFQPDNPIIRGRIEDCLAAEARIDVEGLVARAIAGIERVFLDPEE